MRACRLHPGPSLLVFGKVWRAHLASQVLTRHRGFGSWQHHRVGGLAAYEGFMHNLKGPAKALDGRNPNTLSGVLGALRIGSP